MSYHTDYWLKVANVDQAKYDQIDAALSGMKGYMTCEGVGDGVGSWSDVDDTWYQHEEDMLYLSKQFPDLLFVLEGEGENSGDVWRQYFQNGKTQLCTAYPVYMPFIRENMYDPTEETPTAAEDDGKLHLTSGQEARNESIENAVYQCILAALDHKEEDFPWNGELVHRLEDVMIDFLKKEGYRVHRPQIVADSDGKEILMEYEEG